MSTGQKRSAPSKEVPIEVDPRWLLRAVAFTVAAALLCGYLVLGFLFSQGAWQLILHPTHDRSASPAVGTSAERVQFFADESGKAQIAGQWLPARGSDALDPAKHTSGTAEGYVFLVCRGGDSQLGAADQPTAQLIRSVGGSALFFDYRGFGDSSSNLRPSEQTMTEDADHAFSYLTESRKVEPSRIVLWGSGIGATLAARLAQRHGSAAALVLWNADADAFARILADPRGRLFPVHLLVGSRFDLRTPLSEVKLPKLLFSVGPPDRARDSAYLAAPAPRSTIVLPVANPTNEREALARFLGDHLASPAHEPAAARTQP